MVRFLMFSIISVGYRLDVCDIASSFILVIIIPNMLSIVNFQLVLDFQGHAVTLLKKLSFPLRISSVNVTKSRVSY